MKIRPVLTALVLLVLPVMSLAAEGYPVPDISKAVMVLEEKQYVADRKPPTEIDIKTYKNPDGKFVRVYSVGGSIFRYDVDAGSGPPYEYRLLDTTGNGVFDTKEYMVGEMTVKEKGEKYFIDLGPEPGKEYKYKYYEKNQPGMLERKDILMGYPIFIPQWVILRFKQP